MNTSGGKYLWLWIGLALLGTAIFGSVIFFGFGLLIPVSTGKSGQSVSPFTSSNIYDLTRATLTATGLLVGAGAAVIAYRAQRIKEAQHSIDVAKHEIALSERVTAIEREFRERYGNAARQLGDAAAAVRLAGAFAMGQLAVDWPDTSARQSCVDVLCAYLRIPIRRRRALPEDPSFELGKKVLVPEEGDREVRASIQRIVLDRFKRDSSDPAWQSMDLNLAGAVLVNADFSGRIFRGLVDLSRVRFLGDTDFRGAEFSKFASFDDTEFLRTAMFGSITFREGASFRRAIFRTGLNMSNSRFGGHSRFSKAVISGGTKFSNARFRRGVSFFGTSFDGAVKFVKVRFAEGAWFEKAEFAGNSSFAKANFHSNLTFDQAHFASEPNFKAAGQAMEPKVAGAEVAGASWPGPSISRQVAFRPGLDENFQASNDRPHVEPTLDPKFFSRIRSKVGSFGSRQGGVPD